MAHIGLGAALAALLNLVPSLDEIHRSHFRHSALVVWVVVDGTGQTEVCEHGAYGR